jgi:hypothetical protein
MYLICIIYLAYNFWFYYDDSLINIWLCNKYKNVTSYGFYEHISHTNLWLDFHSIFKYKLIIKLTNNGMLLYTLLNFNLYVISVIKPYSLWLNDELTIDACLFVSILSRTIVYGVDKELFL